MPNLRWRWNLAISLTLAVIIIFTAAFSVFTPNPVSAQSQNLRIKVDAIYNNGLLNVENTVESGTNIIKITNQAPYWVGYKVENAVGQANIQPYDDKTSLLSDFGVLPPQETVTYSIDFSATGGQINISAEAADVKAQVINTILPLLKMLLRDIAISNDWQIVLALLDIPEFVSLSNNLIEAGQALKDGNAAEAWRKTVAAAGSLTSLLNNPDNRAYLIDTLVEKGLINEAASGIALKNLTRFSLAIQLILGPIKNSINIIVGVIYGQDRASFAVTALPVDQYTLKVDILPQGSGSVLISPNADEYVRGTTVTLTASPRNGYVFDHWSGDISGPESRTTVTMNSDKNIIANFAPIQKPDLVVAALSVPSSVDAGDSLSVIFAVKNIGDSPSESSRASIILSNGQDEMTLGVFSVRSLNVGDSARLEVRVNVPEDLTEGNYSITVKADSSQTVTETNDDNNSYISVVSIISQDLLCDELAEKVFEIASKQNGFTGIEELEGIPWIQDGYTCCDRFVSAVVAAALGKDIANTDYHSGYDTALIDYGKHLESHSVQFYEGDPPKGAIVYYGVPDTNEQNGHVGIADGNGKLISVYNTDLGVSPQPLDSMGGATRLGWICPSEYFVTLTLYIRENSLSGPVISGVTITGQDDAGNKFEELTNSDGYVTIMGPLVTWRFTAYKDGYDTKSWFWDIIDTSVKVNFLIESGKLPTTPIAQSPGTDSEPGQMISDLSPILSWNASEDADYYSVAISVYPYGTSNVIYSASNIQGISHKVPEGYLIAGNKYRWNIRAWNNTGSSDYSNTLYFQTSTIQVTLKLYVHENSTSGPVISGVTVVGQDEAGNSFSQVTNSSGYVTIIGSPGTWSFTASKSGYDTKSWYWDITADDTKEMFLTTPLLPAPTLSSPANGANNVVTKPTFSWSEVTGANKYWLTVATSPLLLPTDPYATSAPGCIIDKIVTSTSYTPTSALNNDTTYYWQVQSFNDSGSSTHQGQFSAQWGFTTKKADITLKLYIHENSTSGSVISGASVTGQDGAGNSFSQVTNSSGYVTIIGTPGIWSFTASKNGYNTNSWSQSITSTTTLHAFLTKGNVTLTLYIHESSTSGPIIVGVQVTGQDVAGNTFSEITNSSGYVTITGTPGIWSFTASKSGYNTNSWSQEITSTTTKHAYLISVPPSSPTLVDVGIASSPWPPQIFLQAEPGDTVYTIYSFSYSGPDVMINLISSILDTNGNEIGTQISGSGFWIINPFENPIRGVGIEYKISDNAQPGLYNVKFSIWNDNFTEEYDSDVKQGWLEIVSGEVTLTLYVHENSANGPIIEGVLVTGQDGAGNYFNQTTNSNGYVTITGVPGTWSFIASKSGYDTNSWSQSITTDDIKHAFIIKQAPNVTLTLYVHESNTNGPVISGVMVTGQDGAGYSFSQLTNSSGYATITGAPGDWTFSTSKSGYITNTWFINIVFSETKHVYLIKQVTDITLTLYVHENSASGPVIVGAQVTGQDGAGNSYNQVTNSSGYVTITGVPGTWSFVASKSGYDTNSWSQSITTDDIKHAYLIKQVTNVTLTLYVHENSASGPIIVGVQVTGQDGAGNYFNQTTNSNGYVTITGVPGTWSFTASKSGYDTNSWSQSITTDDIKHAFLIKQVTNVTLTLYVHENSASGPVIVGAQVTGQDGAGNSFNQVTNSSGYVNITGVPGTWSFTASKSGYDTNSWSQSITTDDIKHAFLIKQIVYPQITGISPSQPVVQPTRQWISILGSGFDSQSQVTLRIGGSTYVIPSDRTQFVNSGQINVFVGLTEAGTWSAQVTNPDGYQSNVFNFQVVP